MRQLSALAILLFAPFLTHCVAILGTSQDVALSRNLPLQITDVSVHDGLRVKIRHGRTAGAVLSGDSIGWDLVQLRVTGGKLHVRRPVHLAFWAEDSLVTLTLPNVKKVTMTGKSQVTLVSLPSLMTVHVQKNSQVTFVQQRALNTLLLADASKATGQLFLTHKANVTLQDKSQLLLTGAASKVELVAKDSSKAKLQDWKVASASIHAYGRADLRLSVSRELHYHLNQKAFLMVDGKPVVKAGSLRSSQSSFFQYLR